MTTIIISALYALLALPFLALAKISGDADRRAEGLLARQKDNAQEPGA